MQVALANLGRSDLFEVIVRAGVLTNMYSKIFVQGNLVDEVVPVLVGALAFGRSGLPRLHPGGRGAGRGQKKGRSSSLVVRAIDRVLRMRVK